MKRSKTTVTYSAAKSFMTDESERVFLSEVWEKICNDYSPTNKNYVQIYILDPDTEVDTLGAVSQNLDFNIALLMAMGKQNFVSFAMEYSGKYLYISFSKIFRDKRNKCIVRDAEEGLKSSQIAEKYGMTPEAVRKVIQRYKSDCDK